MMFKRLLCINFSSWPARTFTRYMPNPTLFGWLPFQLFNHWLVAHVAAILGYFFCRETGLCLLKGNGIARRNDV